MANTQRLRDGDGRPIPMQYASGVRIEVGDTLFKLASGGPVVPPSSIQGSHLVGSGLARFVGIAADAHLTTDGQRPGIVWTDGNFNLLLASGNVQPGDYLVPSAVDKISGTISSGLSNQTWQRAPFQLAGEAFAVVTASGGGNLSTVRANVQGVVAGPRSFQSGN